VSDSEADAVTAEAVAGMVAACRPEWRVAGYERAAEGTDFVAFVDCETPDGPREAVLKATTAGFVRPEVARAEPRLYELVGRETSVPVPAVYGSVDAHADYPAPFYLLERVAGENVESDPTALPVDVRERVCRDAGANLAQLHGLRTFDRVGSVGVRDGGLAVVPNDEGGPYADGREWFRDGVASTLDALADGTYFPELADEPDRFADLVPDLRAAFDERLAAMPAPDPPRFCHWDYRWGNLLLSPTTGETRAVLDWANLSTTDPAYNLACVEYHLLHDGDDEATRERHRRALRGAYVAGREGWRFDASVTERMETYALLKRCDAMACLPLWHEEKDRAGRARVERVHREAVAEFVDGD
jgi:aminoglycoside phosphotransferase (APT) family kinase protein